MLEESHNSLGLKQQGNVVYGRNIMHADDLLGSNMTEHPNLLFRRFRQRLGDNKPARNLRHPRASALNINETSEEANQVGQQTEPAQGMHGCLCRLRFLLSVHIRHERDMYKRKVLATDAELELS